MAKPTDLVQGKLDLLILRTLALRPIDVWGIAQRIHQVSRDVLQVNQGARYPALYRLEQQQGWIHAKWEAQMEAPVIGHWAGPRDVLRR